MARLERVILWAVALSSLLLSSGAVAHADLSGTWLWRLGNINFLNPGNDVLTIRTDLTDRQTALQVMPHGNACGVVDLSAIMIYAQDVGEATAGPFNRWSQRYIRGCADPVPVLDMAEHYRDLPPSRVQVGWRNANTGVEVFGFTMVYTGTAASPQRPVIDFQGSRLRNFLVE